jgi:putative membrane protein
MFRKSKDARRKRAQERHPEKQPEKKSPERKSKKRGEISIFGGLAAGIIGGIVATWVLDKYQQGALEVTRRVEDALGAGPVLSPYQEDQMRGQQRAHAETADRLAKSTLGKSLSRRQRRDAVPVVHYAVGALAGAAYGLAAELIPAVRAGYGTGYASLLFMGGSQSLLPGFGFGALNSRAATQGDGLSGHIVYGAVLETTRRALRRFL